MLASTASAPRVTRCSLELYWSRDLCSKHALAGWGMSSYLGQIVRGSEIWWFMTSAHSLSTSLRLVQGLSQDLETEIFMLPIFQGWSHYKGKGNRFIVLYPPITTINMYFLIEIRHNIIIQCQWNYVEVEKFQSYAWNWHFQKFWVSWRDDIWGFNTQTSYRLRPVLDK